MKNALTSLMLAALIAGAGYPAAPARAQTRATERDAHWIHNAGEDRGEHPSEIELSFVEMFGDENDDNFIFYEPRGIASDTGGNIYVLDAKNHRVQVFTPEREFLRSFGRQGQGPGEFQRPGCIDLDSAGNVYIGDPGNARIEVFDPSGTYLRSIRVRATNIVFRIMAGGNILLRNPNLDGGRGLRADHVPLFRLLDPEGNLIREFGQGIFFTQHPYTTGGNRSLMTTDSDDNAYMAFLFQNRICKYSPTGEHIFSADRPVPQEKLLNRELDTYTTLNTGLAVDSEDRIWVVSYTRKWERDEIIHRSYINGQEQISGDRSLTETDMFAIQVFSPEGVLLQTIPLTHYCDDLAIIGDTVYILDRDRLGQFYVYRITDE